MMALLRIPRAIAALACALLLLPACAPPAGSSAEFMATIPPLQMILNEIVGDPGRVGCILPPGASPHTFELRPSTARALESAKAVFYIDDTIDGWAARLAPGRLHAVFPLLPAEMRRPYHGNHHHDHGDGEAHDTAHDAEAMNAHFWSDPLAVKAVVPALVAHLAQADPENRALFEENGARFMAQLDALDAEFRAVPPPAPGYGLIAFHPSWCYFFDRYGIEVADYVEPFPGKEPTPRVIQALKDQLADRNRRIVLSEVQLPAKSAEVLRETLDARLATIDPLGGTETCPTYAQLLRHNAAVVREAFQ